MAGVLIKKEEKAQTRHKKGRKPLEDIDTRRRWLCDKRDRDFIQASKSQGILNIALKHLKLDNLSLLGSQDYRHVPPHLNGQCFSQKKAKKQSANCKNSKEIHIPGRSTPTSTELYALTYETRTGTGCAMMTSFYSLQFFPCYSIIRS